MPYPGSGSTNTPTRASSILGRRIPSRQEDPWNASRRLPPQTTCPVGACLVGEMTLGMPVGAYWAFDADVSKIDTFRAFLAGYSGCQAKILNGKCQQRILSPFGASTKKFPPYTPSRREDLWNTSRRLPGRQEGPRNASRCLPPQTTCPVGACLIGEKTLECQSAHIRRLLKMPTWHANAGFGK